MVTKQSMVVLRYINPTGNLIIFEVYHFPGGKRAVGFKVTSVFPQIFPRYRLMKKKRVSTTPQIRAAKRAGQLIEALLKEMQVGLQDPERLESLHWVQLFGAKQSAVVNLQKLVQALSALPDAGGAKPTANAEYPEGEALSAEEMQLLTAWLGQEQVIGPSES